MKEEKPNATLVAAIQQAEQWKEDGKIRIAEAMNLETKKQIEYLNQIRTKLHRDPRTLDSNELGTLWGLCGTRIAQYENGSAHVCEYSKDNFNCIICGESF